MTWVQSDTEFKVTEKQQEWMRLALRDATIEAIKESRVRGTTLKALNRKLHEEDQLDACFEVWGWSIDWHSGRNGIFSITQENEKHEPADIVAFFQIIAPFVVDSSYVTIFDDMDGEHIRYYFKYGAVFSLPGTVTYPQTPHFPNFWKLDSAQQKVFLDMYNKPDDDTDND